MINDTLQLKIEGLNLIQNKYENYYSIKNHKINESIQLVVMLNISTSAYIHALQNNFNEQDSLSDIYQNMQMFEEKVIADIFESTKYLMTADNHDVEDFNEEEMIKMNDLNSDFWVFKSINQNQKFMMIIYDNEEDGMSMFDIIEACIQNNQKINQTVIKFYGKGQSK